MYSLSFGQIFVLYYYNYHDDNGCMMRTMSSMDSGIGETRAATNYLVVGVRLYGMLSEHIIVSFSRQAAAYEPRACV